MCDGVDIKDVIAKSFFDGLSSPNNSYQYQMAETITIETQDSGLRESDEVAGSCNLDEPCTLNSEDQEIPCNEDVIFSKQLQTMAVSLTGHEKPDYPLFAHVKDSEDSLCVAPEGDSFVSNDSSNSHSSCPQVNPSAIKQEVDALRTTIHHPPPEAEELLTESDDDVPYFSGQMSRQWY